VKVPLNGNKCVKIVLMFCETSGFCYALFTFWCQLEGFSMGCKELLEVLCNISVNLFLLI